MRHWTFAALTISLAALLSACAPKEEPQQETPAATDSAPRAKPAPAISTSTPATPKATVPPPMSKQADQGGESVSAMENAYVSNPDFSARVETIYKLADTGTPAAISSLGRLFHMERDPDLKTEILDSLFDIDGQDEAKAALLAAGAGADQPKEVRQSAIDGLEDVKPEVALPILRALTGDPDEEIRESARDSIEMLQEQQANPAQPN